MSIDKKELENELEGIEKDLDPGLEYNPESEEITITADIDHDGAPDITLKVKVGVVLKRYWPGIATAVGMALVVLHKGGYL